MAQLSVALEREEHVRHLARKNTLLLEWPTLATTGVPSCKSLLSNLKIMLIVADWWSSSYDEPLLIPISVLRAEAGKAQILDGACPPQYK